jgi:hypothetical protein
MSTDMEYTNFNVVLGHNNELTLVFELLRTPIVSMWIQRMELALAQYKLDNPCRFYGFNDYETEAKYALQLINTDISIINAYKPLVSRQLTDVKDQDTLNYLHKIFEDYHGLLDQQNTEFWLNAPEIVRTALANLNIDVHRCESLIKSHPRFVCTYYGLPKTVQFTQDQILQYGELDTHAGGLYINYVEIGKTLEDLAIDKDEHVGNEAIRPFVHYSADFNVKFVGEVYTADLNTLLKDCYTVNAHIFRNNGYDNFDILKPYNFRVAQLTTNVDADLIHNISRFQYVNGVYFS